MGPTLRLGDEGPRVVELATRLQRSGHLVFPSGDSFDDRLEGAVQRFQRQHGLEADGLVGRATQEALNVPVEARIEQLRRNLEARQRFEPLPGPFRILVNIPAFEAHVWRDGEPTVTHRVVVGRVDRPTPELSGQIGHVVLSPYWNVPLGILRQDKLPLIRRDPGYLARSRISVMDRSSERAVDPATIPWATITAGEFNARYWLRQAPGPTNALGLVKLIFPNPHSVYLHDTPDKHLFERSRRSLSSGCIRVDGALALAERILVDLVPGWDAERVARVARGGTESWITLPETIPIQIVYWTAWVGTDGMLHLAEDLYGLDARRPVQPPEETLSACSND
jgi:L,D-transpeptidase YcbB